MKISIIGTRGIPAHYGGFETFAEEISPLLVKEGFEICVQCDGEYKSSSIWNGVELHYSSYSKSKNPILYYLEGIRWGLKNSDIIIVAGTPGSLFYFLNIFRPTAILTNCDGLEFMRQKWSFLPRLFFRLSELLAVWGSDYIIADSSSIKKHLLKSYRLSEKKVRVIEYGAHINNEIDYSVLDKYNVIEREYYLVVSRIEPENNIPMIIEGYKMSASVLPLIIVGDIRDHKYVKSLIKNNVSQKIRFVGGIYNRNELNSLRFGCKAYLHGHSVGGTNPSLLEAMANKNIVVCHDNVFNREVTRNTQLYFRNFGECAERILLIEAMTNDEIEKIGQHSVYLIANYYNWNNILRKYLELFNSIEIKLT